MPTQPQMFPPLYRLGMSMPGCTSKAGDVISPKEMARRERLIKAQVMAMAKERGVKLEMITTFWDAEDMFGCLDMEMEREAKAGKAQRAA